MTTQQSFAAHPTSGTLYLVPTPIGNLQDMTYRAVATLKAVDLIAAEDTRNTQKLLNHFEIKTKQISFHEHNTQERLPQLLADLKSGQNLAQVSDAGMPSISDPGTELVAACVRAEIPVVPLPGANAGLTALIASGLTPQPFYFYGFLPRKPKEQLAVLQHLANRTATMIFYESPYRVLKTLTVMQQAFGAERAVVACRELTKRYEEFSRGTVSEVLAWFTEHQPKGEFVLLVAGNPAPQTPEAAPVSTATLKVQVQELIDQGERPNAAIKAVAKAHQLKKQVVYNEFHDITTMAEEQK